MNWTPSLNPIVLREIRSRMRGRRTVIVLTAYVSLLALLTGLIYFATYESYASRYQYQFSNPTIAIPLAEFGPEFGRALLIGTLFLLLVLFSFIAPAFGAGAIAGEKGHQTYDTLLITTLGARQIVWGKVGAIFTLLLLFVALSLPIQFMAFFFGGVALPDLVIATFALSISVLAFCTFGVYISTIARTTTMALIISYAIIVPIVYIVPFFSIIYIESGPSRFSFRPTTESAAYIYKYVTAVVMSTNPFFAAIVSGAATFDGKGYFYYEMSDFLPRGFGGEVWLPAPWIICCTFSLWLTFLFITLATRRVRKISTV